MKNIADTETPDGGMSVSFSTMSSAKSNNTKSTSNPSSKRNRDAYKEKTIIVPNMPPPARVETGDTRHPSLNTAPNNQSGQQGPPAASTAPFHEIDMGMVVQNDSTFNKDADVATMSFPSKLTGAFSTVNSEVSSTNVESPAKRAKPSESVNSSLSITTMGVPAPAQSVGSSRNTRTDVSSLTGELSLIDISKGTSKNTGRTSNNNNNGMESVVEGSVMDISSTPGRKNDDDGRSRVTRSTAARLERDAETTQATPTYPPLHQACMKNDMKRVEQLIDGGADMDEKDHHGFAPLHWAAMDGHIDVMKVLLGKRADMDTRDNNGETPLHIAVRESEHRSVIDLLLDYGASMNTKSNSGETALHVAVSFAGDVDVVKALIEKGANVHATENRGRTPLYGACVRGYLETVKTLVEDHGGWIDVKEEQRGLTPLHIASEKGHLHVVKFLVESNADIEARTKSQWTPLQIAQKEMHYRIVQLLRSRQTTNRHAAVFGRAIQTSTQKV